MQWQEHRRQVKDPQYDPHLHAGITGYIHSCSLTKHLTWDSIQSNRLLMYSGAESLVGFFTLTPSAQRYSYCTKLCYVLLIICIMINVQDSSPWHAHMQAPCVCSIMDARFATRPRPEQAAFGTCIQANQTTLPCTL